MLNVNRLKEIRCRRRFLPSPRVPTCGVSLVRVAKSIEGLFPNVAKATPSFK